MKQEDKELLLKDLCARVPYHPKGHVVNACTGAECDEWLTCATFTMFTSITNNSRLYLRPMSSMTEEELTELAYKVFQQPDINIVRRWVFENKSYPSIDGNPVMVIDWLNSRHFDYRGLIPKGLALEALEG